MIRILVVLIAAARAAEVTQNLKASLVLTPEFCQTKIARGSRLSGAGGLFRRETFEVGKAACAQMEAALRPVFASIVRTDKEQIGAAHLLVTPRFVDLNATLPRGPAPAFSNRELIVLLEWTAKNSAGQTVWVETVEGSATRRMGNVFTRDRKRLIEMAIKDLLERSARRMSDAPELKQLARQPRT